MSQSRLENEPKESSRLTIGRRPIIAALLLGLFPKPPELVAASISKKIVAIGNAPFQDPQYSPIYEEIVRLANTDDPRILSIPTAGGDNPGSRKYFRNFFRDRFGFITDELLVASQTPSDQEISEKILTADIIYVGGGRTLMMMNRWRELGIDQLLKTAYEKGTVLSGTSAGANCWFEYGYSDSMKYINPSHWSYILVKGLGLINGIYCPHFDDEDRARSFMEMIGRSNNIVGFAQANTALMVKDRQYKVISPDPADAAFKLCKKEGKVVKDRIEQSEDFAPLASLYQAA